MEILILFLGFILLMKGADFFVDGASSLASIFKIPSIIVGLTIVSFGTSAPEAAVSVFASIAGANDIALSNVVGSNIFNLLVVLASTTLLAKIVVPKNIIKFDFPFLIIVSSLTLLLISDDLILGFYDALILFTLIIFYVAYLIYKTTTKKHELNIDKPKFNLPLSIVFVLIGLTMIIFGGNVTVESAKKIALFLGMSEKLVGLTIVSIETSLPELITSLVAVKKGEVDIALGNAVGSNIFNLLFILGLSGLIVPITINPLVIFDTVFMLVITIICFVIAKFNKKLNYTHGLFLLSTFIFYLIYIIIRN